MSGGCPQRHVQHDDAVHDNERGNHHDENEVPEECGVRDVTSQLPHFPWPTEGAARSLTSQTHPTQKVEIGS